MNRRADIIKVIKSISGKYSEYEIFTDWIRCMALSISNTVTFRKDDVWHERERMYVDTMRKYTEEEVNKLCEMAMLLVETLEEGPDDVLGKIYMESGMGSRAAGQFFTPFHVAELTAKLGIHAHIDEYMQGEKLTINEPTCGGGAMIIASAKALKDEGFNYQKMMDVVAQDLDWKGVYMCYVQLSLLGIRAVCVQGDTLQQPYVKGQTERSHILYTPAKMGVLF